jgi:hypothetical protein
MDRRDPFRPGGEKKSPSPFTSAGGGDCLLEVTPNPSKITVSMRSSRRIARVGTLMLLIAAGCDALVGLPSPDNAPADAASGTDGPTVDGSGTDSPPDAANGYGGDATMEPDDSGSLVAPATVDAPPTMEPNLPALQRECTRPKRVPFRGSVLHRRFLSLRNPDIPSGRVGTATQISTGTGTTPRSVEWHNQPEC